MKKIVSTTLIVYDEMNVFYKELERNIGINQAKGEEVEIQYSHNSVGNSFSALILGRKEV